MTIRRARSAFTLTEVLLGLALLSIVIVLLASLHSSFTSYSKAAIETCDAVRSVLIAAELLRNDVDRMYFKVPGQDLAIGRDGRSISFRVPKQLGDDPWEVENEPVIYTLREASPGTEVFRLVRRDWRGEKVVGGSLLHDMLVRVVLPSGPSRFDAFLEITLVGTSGLDGKKRHVGTLMLPIKRVMRPSIGYVPPEVEA